MSSNGNGNGNGIKTVGLTGVGGIGSYIANAFVADKSLTVYIFTRDTSKAALQEYASKGAKLVRVDYADAAALQQALTGVDAVVSTLGPAGESAQPAIAQAAKAAGVKLFVPSLFGNDYWHPKSAPLNPIVQGKVEFVKSLEALQLPWFGISTGLFSHYAFFPGFGFDVPARKALRIPGDGTGRLSSTHPDDIASFTHHVVTTQPLPAPGSGTHFRIEGFNTSFHELIAEAERQDGKKWQLGYWPYDELKQKELEPSGPGFLAWLGSSLADSRQALDPALINAKDVGYTKPLITKEEAVRQLLAAPSA